jgi:hypothetical protein
VTNDLDCLSMHHPLTGWTHLVCPVQSSTMTISIYARLIIYLGIICLSVIAILRMKPSPFHDRENSFGSVNFPNSRPSSINSTSQHGSCPSPPARTPVKAILPEWDSSHYIEGKPTMAFRGQLALI